VREDRLIAGKANLIGLIVLLQLGDPLTSLANTTSVRRDLLLGHGTKLRGRNETKIEHE